MHADNKPNSGGEGNAFAGLLLHSEVRAKYSKLLQPVAFYMHAPSLPPPTQPPTNAPPGARPVSNLVESTTWESLVSKSVAWEAKQWRKGASVPQVQGSSAKPYALDSLQLEALQGQCVQHGGRGLSLRQNGADSRDRLRREGAGAGGFSG